MCIGTGEYKVDGKGVGKWGVAMASEFAFLHGRKCYKGGLAITRHTAASWQECESPSAAQSCPTLEPLGLLYWCWGSVDKFNLERWSTVKFIVVGFWQLVRTCKVQKQCYCSVRLRCSMGLQQRMRQENSALGKRRL